MKTFKSFLTESKEVSVVQVYPLSKYLLEYLKKFQEFLKDLKLDIIPNNDFAHFNEKIKPYLKYSFAKILAKNIKEYQNQSTENQAAITRFKIPDTSKIKQLFLAKNYTQAYSLLGNIPQVVNDYFKQTNLAKAPFTKLQNIKKGGFSALFSGGQRTGFMSILGKEQIEEVINKNLEQFKYSYIIPVHNSLGELSISDGTNEIEYMMYLISNGLKNTPKPVRLDAPAYEIYNRIGNPKFSELRNLVNQYVFNNDKAVVDQIKTLITPEIKQAIIASCRGIKTVYRGLSGHYSKDYAKQEDLKIKYISTTPSDYVAERFARGIGHLDDPKTSRNEEGTILVYDISNRDSIILNTAIFGVAYGESDILIDATKAKLIQNISKRFYTEH